MAKKAAPKPRLRLCAAAWTMTNYPSAKKQWSADTKVRKAKEAGFDGFSAGAQEDVIKACAKHGMELVGGVDVGKVSEAAPKMRAFAEAGATHVNVQLCDHDTPTAKKKGRYLDGAGGSQQEAQGNAVYQMDGASAHGRRPFFLGEAGQYDHKQGALEEGP